MRHALCCNSNEFYMWAIDEDNRIYSVIFSPFLKVIIHVVLIFSIMTIRLFFSSMQSNNWCMLNPPKMIRWDYILEDRGLEQ